MRSSELPESVARNVAYWAARNADGYGARAAAQWARDEVTWGVFGVPDREVGALGDVRGLDVVELGCGTAYISAWFAKRGARPVGVDPTPAQLATARRLQAETGIEFPLLEAPAESVPLADASFDLAVSEYGASLWAVPERWVAEAARLLRPGGRLVFLTNSVLITLCLPDTGFALEELQRPQRSIRRLEWPGEDSVEYHPTHGEWIEVLRANGFEIEALHELYAPEEMRDAAYEDLVTGDWGRQWPAEDLWVARKR
ncbi:MAG: class I SAM-dependent methyltransferase [Actinobacteria bacterium]|nr:MAG: class I SAM-dependent methyltransferase [Actinomycetota bacterium]